MHAHRQTPTEMLTVTSNEIANLSKINVSHRCEQVVCECGIISLAYSYLGRQVGQAVQAFACMQAIETQ